MKAQRLEKGDRKVVHGVDSCAVLEDHQEAAMNEPRDHLLVEGFRHHRTETRG